MSIWHVEACRHTQMRCISPNETQCFIALLHHVCLTCGSMQTYPNEMYPPNQTQCFRALLHNVSLTCGSMQTYPNEMYPPKLIPVLHSPTTPCPFDMWKHADIPKWDVSSLIKPSASEPYYTMSVWHVEACRHTQMRCISPNQTQCFRALLHHVSLTCGMYPA